MNNTRIKPYSAVAGGGGSSGNGLGQWSKCQIPVCPQVSVKVKRCKLQKMEETLHQTNISGYYSLPNKIRDSHAWYRSSECSIKNNCQLLVRRRNASKWQSKLISRCPSYRIFFYSFDQTNCQFENMTKSLVSSK